MYSTAAATVLLGASRTGHQQVQIAHGLASAAQRPSRHDLFDSRELLQVEGHSLGRGFGVVQQKAAAVLAIFSDSARQLLDQLLSEAGQSGQLAGVDCSLQLFDVAYLQRLPKKSHRLRSHARQLQQLQHGGAIFCQQFVAQLQASAGFDFLDVRRHALADSLNGKQPRRLVHERTELFGTVLYRFGGPPVRADTEGSPAAISSRSAVSPSNCAMDLLSMQRTLNHFVEDKEDCGRKHSRSPTSSPGVQTRCRDACSAAHLGVRCLGYFSNSSYGIGLRSFLPLNDVEFHLVPFF